MQSESNEGWCAPAVRPALCERAGHGACRLQLFFVHFCNVRTPARIGKRVFIRLACLLAVLGGSCGTTLSAEPQETAAASVPVSAFPMVNFAGEGNLLRDAEFPGQKWIFFPGRKDVSIHETWRMGVDAETKSPILVCLGEPHGYLRTRAEHVNFDLHLEWRFPRDPDGNSGILLFTSGEDRVWPSSLQIQLHQPELGIVFPIGGAKSVNELRPMEKLAKPVNQWNQCEIQCRQGTVSVSVNGRSLGEVTGCLPSAGAIALQSEGSEIHFRNIWIREVPVIQAEVPLPSRNTATDSDHQRQ